MAKKNLQAATTEEVVAAKVAELNGNEAALAEFVSESMALAEKLATAENTIAELMEQNSNLAETKSVGNVVKIGKKQYSLAIPASFQRIGGEMVKVDAEYLQANPSVAEELLAKGSPIFKEANEK